MSDRFLVFLAFTEVLLLILVLVIFKGCTGAEPIMLVLGGSITTLIGILGGISRGAHPDTVTTTTTGNPPETKTESK
jgi:hypothetical protein